MEAMDGFEPSTQGFADLRLTRFDYIAMWWGRTGFEPAKLFTALNLPFINCCYQT